MIREAGAAGDEQGALDLLRSLSGNQASASYQDRIQALQWWTPVIQQHDKKVHTLHANTEEQKQTSNARHELWRQIDAEECRKDPWLKRKKQRGKRVCKKLPERFALDYPEIATLNKETVHRQADGGGNPR
jgi:hypothetical protein